MQLNEEQKLVGRRNFLKAAATLPAAGAFGWAAMNVGPVKCGIVGTGMEGRVLLEAIDPSYINIHGMCDIRPDNRAIGNWTISQKLKLNPNPVMYEKYEDMLNDPAIEAVLIAAPLHMHGPMTIQALNADKHVFTEKTMAASVDECLDMTRLAKQKNLNLQVGHMRFYNPLYWDAYRMYTEGLLGNVYHIRGAWHRNTDWNYWRYIEQKHFETMQKFDPTPWDYENVEHLVNWRWYNKTSHGMWTELCSHQIAITNWFFGDKAPMAVHAVGTHCKSPVDLDELYRSMKEEERARLKNYEGDPREINDHIYAIYEYENNRTVTYSSIQSNAYDKAYEQIMGTWGTVVLMNENESYLFWEPGWDEKSAQEAVIKGNTTQVAVTQESSDGSAFAAHNASGESKGGGGASDMAPTEPYTFELQGFAHTIRTGAPNLCDGRRGTLAAQAVYCGQEAATKNQRIEIPVLDFS